MFTLYHNELHSGGIAKLTTNGAYLCALLVVVMVQPGIMPAMLVLLQKCEFSQLNLI